MSEDKPNADPSLVSGCQANAELRLQAIEKKLQDLQPPERDGWDKMQILASLLTPILAGVLGFFLIDVVRLGFERQQLQISSAKDMESLIAQMANPQLTEEQAEIAALSLAAFGQFAVSPLIHQIQTGDPNRVIAGEIGLRAVGMSEHEVTCSQLTRVIENRTQLFRWGTHLSAIRLLGDLDCKKALKSLQEYERLLKQSASKDGLEGYRRIVETRQEVTLESVTRLSEELTRTLQIVGTAPASVPGSAPVGRN